MGVSFWKLRQRIQIILACVGFSSTWNSTKSRKSIDYFHATESASFHGKCFSFKYLSNIISKRDFCHDRNYSRKCLVFLTSTLHNTFCIIQIFFCYIPLQYHVSSPQYNEFQNKDYLLDLTQHNIIFYHSR